MRRPSDQTFEKRITIVDDEGDRATFDGPSLVILPVTADTLVIDKQPYRIVGALFINARGLINVINELNFEEYLYGVVPAEMGPSIYDEVEALKAQAVAARTYAVPQPGQFESRGLRHLPRPRLSGVQRIRRASTSCRRAPCARPRDSWSRWTASRSTRSTPPHAAARPATWPRCSPAATSHTETRASASSWKCCRSPDAPTAACSTEAAGRRPHLRRARRSSRSGTSWSARDVAQAAVAAMRLAGFTEMTPPLPLRRAAAMCSNISPRSLGLDEAGATLTMPEDRHYYFPQTQNPEAVPYLAARSSSSTASAAAVHRPRLDSTQPMPREELYALLLGPGSASTTCSATPRERSSSSTAAT